ncbi:uncharacterized protein LOC128549426 isoform X2 [Mercenaria mercenaria]|uniref:uncharacterized protein LOC128549426 isoform X2 n=1 Tax=Mercenaria mercenaria TaxID=6596 RepID=UPI00234F6982|nr:uncharacterized protein LOC128549426 isoform X2 [Mercenaria mercenaria]
MQKEEEKLEFEMQNIKKGIADVTKEVTEVEGNVHTVTKDLHKLREDFKATDKRVDRLEKQRIFEGTQKRGKKPSVLKRILEKLPFMRGQKKGETETSRLHSAADDEYIHMKKRK